MPPMGTARHAVTPAARISARLRAAELARFRDDHQAMINARRALKDLAPALLQDYLHRLAIPRKNWRPALRKKSACQKKRGVNHSMITPLPYTERNRSVQRTGCNKQ